MKRSPAAAYNLITALFGLLSVLSCACIGGLLVLRPSALGRQVAIVPTSIIVPTDTATYTPSVTFTPSPTFTVTNTRTPLPTSTVVPTDTVVPTATPPPTDIPTAVPTAKNTPAIVATAAAIGTAAPNLAFAPATDAPSYSPNPDSTTGCNVMAIAGQVLDQNGAAITTKIEVYIAGPNNYKKLAYPSAANVAPFGVGFWLLVINGKVNNNAYVVEVLDIKGTQISSPVTVKFASDCKKNIALVNFQQTSPITLP